MKLQATRLQRNYVTNQTRILRTREGSSAFMKNRVVVTGLGVVAPNGIGAEAFWESLVKGKSGIGPITLFDASQWKGRIAGEIKSG